MAKYIKGMYQDTPEVDQPTSTWRYAKNALLSKVAGGITNEGGIERLVSLTGAVMKNAERIIGKIEVSDNRAIIFTTTEVLDYSITNPIDGSVTEYSGTVSGIYQLTGDDLKLVLITRPLEYGPLLEDFNVDFNLKFRLTHPIEGTFKINSEKELLIYWTDNLNYPRSLNVTRQLSFEDDDDDGNPPAHALRVYGRDPELSTNKNYIDRLNLFPHSGPVPTIEFKSINSSGGLETGVYYLALAYVDTDHTYTNFLTVSMPVSIVDEPEGTIPGHRVDGAPAGTVTGKSITWDVANLNNDYDFIRPVVISIKGGAETAVMLKDLDIRSTNMTVTYTGMEGYTPAALAEVIIDTVNYDTAKTMAQLDDVLYLGNLSGTKDVGYQKYANNMGLIPVTKTIDNFDPYEISQDNLLNGYSVESSPFPGEPELAKYTQGYRNPDYNVKYRGYTRDEVYAIYIAFIMNDGSMSYAYHVPGREARVPGELDEIQKSDDPLNPPNPLDVCDDSLSNYQARRTVDDALHVVSGGAGRKFHFYDYSNEEGAWGMNYWHNQNEFYPDTEDYDVWNSQGYLTTLRNRNVRHHHFPSNESIDYRFLDGDHEGTDISLSETGDDLFYKATFKGLAFNEGYELGGGQGFPNSFIFDVNQNGESMLGMWPYNSVNGTFTLDEGSEMPLEGDCVYCKGSDLGDDYDACNCKGWFFGKATYWAGNLHIQTGTTGTQADCPCAYSVRESENSIFGTDAFNNEDENGTECSYVGTPCNDYDPSNVGDAADAPVDGCHNGYNNIMLESSGPDTQSRGRCYWRNKNTQISVSEGGEYITRKVKILGFHLMNMYIPDEIKNKTQGFRIYYAKRDHHNRRILGQDFGLPMRHGNKAVNFCNMDFIKDKHKDWLGKYKEAEEIKGLLGISGGANSDNQFYKDIWIKDCFVRDKETYKKPDYDICGYNVFSFHDFYMLNSHNSVAHATHFKPEYIVKMETFKGIGIKKAWNMFVNGDSVNQFPAGGNGCSRKGVVNSFFIGSKYSGADSDIVRGHLQGVLNRPIQEKSKTYLRGDSMFKAKSLGFGYDLYNEHGESCLAFQVVKERGLPPLKGETNWSGDNSNIDDSYVSTDSMRNKPWPTALGDKVKMYQGNLHAFKLDMYNSLDTNTLVWTGYEVVGDDYINFGTGLGDSTINVHPEGIFGGDTIIARHGWRSTIRPKWHILYNDDGDDWGDPETGDKPGRDLRAAYMTICESSDNINFRHMGVKTQGQDTYIPGAPLQDILTLDNNIDLTFNMGDNTTNNMRYNEDYSRLNDVRVPFPLPAKEVAPDKFPTRVHRTQRNDPTSLMDNYRIALANQYRDLPKNKGELQSISGISNLLYLHMTDTLFRTVGKETLELGASVNAYIGTGDIFDRNPQEISQTYYGHGGTSSQFANLVTSLGYFWVDQASRKIFILAGDQPTEISAGGMRQWFKKNIPYELETYGMTNSANFDNPFHGMGFTSTWDPENERILLTKKDLSPTAWFKRGLASFPNPVLAGSYAIRWNETTGTFQHTVDANQSEFFENFEIEGSWGDMELIADATVPTTDNPLTNIMISWTDENMEEEDCLEEGDAFEFINDGQGGIPACVRFITGDERLFEETGWTISFYPELGIWVSFHDYTPSVYILTGNRLLSARSDRHIIYEHNTIHYGDLWDDGTHRHKSDFVFEFIHNENNNDSKKFYNFHYNADVWQTVPDESGGTEAFRHVKLHNNGFTSFYVYTTFQNSGETEFQYLTNVRNTSNDWKVNQFRDISLREQAADINNYYTPNAAVTTSETQPMFLYDGMNKVINPDFLDPNGVGTQGKFTDKFIGICLKYNNESENLVSLYSTQVGMRKYFR